MQSRAMRRSGAHEPRRRRCRAERREGAAQMSTEPLGAQEAFQPPDEGIPFGAKLRQLAEQRCDDTALTVIARDGMGRSMTFAELDRRANQWGRALTASGAEIGSLVAPAVPNSGELVLGV